MLWKIIVIVAAFFLFRRARRRRPALTCLKLWRKTLYRRHKIHFSFVQHSGKPACKQVASIEAALKVDGGDGALYLAEAVKNNTMERRRAKALEDQKASGAKYPAPMFTSMGGTTAQRSKTGQCVFRQVSLVPGMKTDYALQVVEADGEPTATGGISMKKGAQVTRITVGLKREELLSMASAILMAWQAYMIASSAYGTLGAKSYADVQDADVPDAAANRQMPVKVVTTTASTAWVVYDSLGETFEVAVSHDAAILCVQESITFLRKTEQCYSRKDNNEYNAVKTAIQTDCDELPSITLYGKDNTTCEVIVVKRTIRKSPQEAQLPSGQAS